MTNIPQSRLRNLKTWIPGSRDFELLSTDTQPPKPFLDLASNDYLGLSRHPAIIDAVEATIRKEGVGAGGSRFITGSRPIHKSLEEELADWLQREKVFLFPSGFQANIAAVTTLADRHTPVLADYLCHNSLLIGVKTSGAKLYRFKHNDCMDLEKCLGKAKNKYPNSRPLVITESLFSMQGTSPEIKNMAHLCDKYEANFLVDEAHALGVLGPNGKGLSHGIHGSLAMISGTFGKAFGSGGAFLATNHSVGEKLLQECGAFRYTTALAPPLASAALTSLSLIKANKHWGLDLQKQAKIWHLSLNKKGWQLPPVTGPIMPIIFGSDEEALYRQQQLEKKGLLSIAIRPPTVPEGSSRLRIVIRKGLPNQTLEKVIDALENE